MIKVASEGDTVCAPPRESERPAIDLDHLARMTFGDRRLEAEVLRLFDRQSEMLLGRMEQAAPRAVAALAHTLKGSARGIGAHAVADAADELEHAAGQCSSLGLNEPRHRLWSTVEEARAAIAKLLESHRA